MEQPSLRTFRNRDEWKSDNCGIKETISIQNGNRRGDPERASPTHTWVIKIQEDHLWSEGSQPHTRPRAQGSSAWKISPHNFWLQKPVEIESVEEFHWLWISKQFLLKNPHMDLHRVTLSGLQPRGSSLKSISGIQGRTEVPGIKTKAGGQPSPRQKGRQRLLSFSEHTPHRDTELAGECHIWHSISQANTVCPGDSLRLHPPNLQAHPNCEQWLFPLNG